jgi:NAD(P)-dependent dehydrogenase (short-subunit alcohol dehydrogenase family)
MRHVCIFGGGAALAQAVIDRFVARGDSVTAVCRDTVPAQEYPSLTVIRCVHLGVPETYGDEFKKLAPIDVLVTMTGESHKAKLGEMNLSQWQSGIDANLTTVFSAFQIGYPKLKTESNVVVVGSIVGSTGGYGCANYAAAKAGLVGLVRGAANEWAKRDICVNLLELGYCDVGMGGSRLGDIRDKIRETVPLKRFAQPSEVADAIEFLANVRYMTGNVLTLAGGLR